MLFPRTVLVRRLPVPNRPWGCDELQMVQEMEWRAASQNAQLRPPKPVGVGGESVLLQRVWGRREGDYAGKVGAVSYRCDH